MINYAIKVGNEEKALTPQEIMYQMNAALQGSNKFVESVTPDGRYMQINQAGESIQVPIRTALEKMGMQVSSAMPRMEDVDFSGINPLWRYSINNLENDAQKRAYLEQKMQEEGLTNFSIEGTGRDWFAYDPMQSKYVALTNSPDWDAADAAEGLTEAIKIGASTIGGVIGGTLGAPTGPGAIITAGGGAGLGNMLGETITRGIASLDPAYRDAFDLEEAAKSSAANSLFATAGGAAGKGVGRLLSKVGITNPLQSVAKYGGGATEDVGTVVNAAGQIISTPVGAATATAFTPGLGMSQLAGGLMQAPKMIMDFGKNTLGKMTSKFAPGSEEAIRAAIQKAEQSTFGKTMQSLSNVGSGIERGAESVLKGTGKVMQGAGAGMQKGGQLLKRGAPIIGGAEETVYRSIPRGAQSLAEKQLMPSPPQYPPPASQQFPTNQGPGLEEFYQGPGGVLPPPQQHPYQVPQYLQVGYFSDRGPGSMEMDGPI